MSTLIVGATGLVGGEICRLLSLRRTPFRALARTSSNPGKVAALRALGAEVVTGDLKDPSSLDAACRGVSTVISTASATVSRAERDSIDTVDRGGQLNIIDAAARTGVKQFVLISFPHAPLEFPLQSAKRAAEERLQRSGLTYTILQPTFFTEVWLGPALGCDLANARAQIYGAGVNKVSWISFQDVAAFAVAALDVPSAKNAVVKLGGPDALSPLDAVALAERSFERKFEVQHVPEEALRAQYDAATDPMQRSFAALMLYYASGDVVDMRETAPAFGMRRLRSVQDYFNRQAAGV